MCFTVQGKNNGKYDLASDDAGNLHLGNWPGLGCRAKQCQVSTSSKSTMAYENM